MSEKLKELANMIVSYSISVSKGEKVLITTQSLETREFISYLIEAIYKCGGVPSVKINDPILGAQLSEGNTDERIDLLKKIQEHEVDLYDSFISIRYNVNDYEGKNTHPEMQKKLSKALFKSSDVRVNQRKWVLLNYPSLLDAYKAGMTSREFQNFALDVMTVNYCNMNQIIKPLKDLMDKTDKVRIVSPGTDLTFSIKGMKSVPCTGEKNIPDGELYSAPIKNSVNGTITYNTPSPYQGNVYNNVCLEFKDGKIIKATCSEDDKKLNEIFDTDEGARYVGEFSLGFNPKILYPMGDILYDEKILGSLHFTPGQAYKDCYNGNDSGIHWDMVLIQRKDYGGGEIYFDDVLIRKDGVFVLDELKPLNFDYKG
ncbi:MAG: aminopeptidase [Firmicutes bacterium]|nr:aminopeptidase [Bacillota bacterium]